MCVYISLSHFCFTAEIDTLKINSNKKCKKKSGLSFCHLPPTVLTKFNAQKFQNWRCDDYIAKVAF